MLDWLGREINYMRVSITDRCNLRCVYCMPPEGVPHVSHTQVLRYEEILRVCAIAAGLGIRAIKVTGGEPLVRAGCIDFLRTIKATPGIESLTLTTNGVLLEAFADQLAELKLDSVNISLDSLDANTYMQITRRGSFSEVWRGLGKALSAGLRVKINCLPMRGQNDAEIPAFARLSERIPVDVRFIELMPTAGGESFEGLSGEEVLGRLLEIYHDLAPAAQEEGFGPARYFSSGKMLGRIGIIGAGGGCICSECNRVRLTSEGFLRLCLFHGDGLDLRGMLRAGAPDAEIQAAFEQAVLRKPGGQACSGAEIKNMSRVGG